MPLKKEDAADLVKRRHPEWVEHQRHWRFLADSLEGGQRYKHADYTADPTKPPASASASAPWYNYGVEPTTSEPFPFAYRQIVDRNLIPHLRETGTDGRDIYILRLARTPVPALVERTVESHLSRVFAREVRRDGPPALKAWWEDVDGRGTPMDRWVLETVGPMLLALGQLDLCFGHPAAPEGVTIRTRADASAAGVASCVAGLILPENLVWWELDARGGAYAECVSVERDCSGAVSFRHHTAAESNAYTPDGDLIGDRSGTHPFGCVPVVRVFDRRKPRCSNVGRSRYDSIAGLQKAIYNAESERILSDVQQSHAQLSGPEEYCQGTSEIPIGPDKVLPKKPIVGADGGTTGYASWDYLEPPKGAQEAVRQHIQDFQDTADRDGALSKPAGMTAGTTTAQSGISKIADQQDGNAVLARIAEALGSMEARCAAMALRVLADGPPDPADLDAVTVAYPKQFDLFTAADLTQALTDLQMIAAGAGALPMLQGELLNRLVGVLLPGIDDTRLTELRAEVETFLASASRADDDATETEAETETAAPLVVSTPS